MDKPNNLAEVLSAYVDHIEDPQLLELLESKFHETGLIEADVHLGEGDAGDNLKYQLQKQGTGLSEGAVSRGFTAVGAELTASYRQRERKVNLLFWGIVVFVVLAILLLLIANLLGQTGFPFTGVGAGLISALILPLYQAEHKKLQKAEDHIQRINFFKAQLELLELIPDEAARKAGYQRMVASLAGGDDLRHATVIHNYGPVDKQVNIRDHQGDVNVKGK